MDAAVFHKVSGRSKCGTVTSPQTDTSASCVVDVAVGDSVIGSAVAVEKDILI